MSNNKKPNKFGAPGNNSKQQQGRSVDATADALKNLNLATGGKGTQPGARNQVQKGNNAKNQPANPTTASTETADPPADPAQGPCPICGDHPYCCPGCGASDGRNPVPTGDNGRIVARPPRRNGKQQRTAYTPGTIIAAPYHTTNFTKGVKEDDRNLRRGDPPIYSKIRPMVILWVYYDKAFAAPIFTNGGRGLEAFPQDKKDEYVPIVKQGNKDRDTESVHPPVEAVIPWLDTHSNVSLTGGVNVDFEDKIRIIGHLTEDSHKALCLTWQDVANNRYDLVLSYLEDLSNGRKQRVKDDL